MKPKKWYNYKRIGVRVETNLFNIYMNQLIKEEITAQDDLHNYIANRESIRLLSDADNRQKNLSNPKVPALTRKKMKTLTVEDVKK